ncbi:MAG TPA: hypothetical protein VLU41_04510 [Ideonella sp.]|nr:hypothetical protein [Ideonella sp.]
MIIFSVSPLARACAALLGSLAIGCAAPAFAKDAAKAAAEDAYKTQRQACDSMSGNAKDVCVAEAKAERDKAKAQAEADAKGTPKARYHAQMTAAKADYKVAEEKCDEQSGNAKDVCEKEAKAARDKAEADAKAARDTRDARHDAAETRNEADYKVAKEKCDALSGDAKDACVDKAKARYHQ